MKKLILSIAIVLTLNSCTTPDQPTTQTNQGTTDLFEIGIRGIYTKGLYDNLGNLIQSTDTIMVVEKNKITLKNTALKNSLGGISEITSYSIFETHAGITYIRGVNGANKTLAIHNHLTNFRYLSTDNQGTIYWYPNAVHFKWVN